MYEKYGEEKIDSHIERECLKCDWKGYTSELFKIPIYDGYDEDGESLQVDAILCCPNCTNKILD